MIEEREQNNNFRFEAWWLLEDSFLDQAKFLWENSVGELLQKLENLKKGLKK